MLTDHLKGGGTIRSFGAKCHAGKDTIYGWLKEYPEFADARKEGEGYQHEFYQNMGKMIATGQLRRVKSETVRLGTDGKPLYDRNGDLIYDRTYEPANGSATAWIFMCKNILGWRDRQDIEMSGKEGGPINFSNLSREELDKKIAELVAKAKKK